MKIYAVIHYYDNGLVYEDNRDYVNTDLYSDLNEASKIYQSKTSGEYEGAYELVEWEIDTNNKKTLQETGYNPCTPDDPWDDDEWEYTE